MTRAALESVVIIDAVRTPIGKYAGALSSVRPDDLAAIVLKALLARQPKLDPALIDDVLIGCANQAGEDNRNVARMAVLLAELPITVGGGTVNRLCGSGLMAINEAACTIASGQADVMIAGGVESMSRAPLVMAKPDTAFPRGDQTIHDTTLGWRFTNPALAKLHYPYAMGETAENVAEQYKITRERQDAFALASQQKYQQAHQAGAFNNEIIPVTIPQRKGDPKIVSVDEHPRLDCKIEDLSKLNAIFRDGGSVTAGNSSGINDGASALLLMHESKAQQLGLVPMARLVSTAVAGVDPAIMGIGPVPAIQKALSRTVLSIESFDTIELNEAFAAQSLACMDQLKLDPDTVNRLGGAIALGHPLGCSGARIMTTLLHQMRGRPQDRYGVASMCIGVGQGIATIIEVIH